MNAVPLPQDPLKPRHAAAAHVLPGRLLFERIRWRWLHVAAAFAAGVVVSGLALALILPRPPNVAGVLRASADSSLSATRPVPQLSVTLDVLRAQALMGDEMSSRHLIGTLMDRFDAGSDPSELYEAMLWVDRRWDTSGQAELAARVVSRYCGQRVVQWHWMCDTAE